VLSTMIAAPAMAQQVYQDRYDQSYHRGPVGAAADTAVGIAGAAVGTAAAVATSPFRDSRDSYAYDNRGGDYYGNQRDYGPEGYACHPGTWITGQDGRKHICQ
jgi:hypothetical protein